MNPTLEIHGCRTSSGRLPAVSVLRRWIPSGLAMFLLSGCVDAVSIVEPAPPPAGHGGEVNDLQRPLAQYVVRTTDKYTSGFSASLDATRDLTGQFPTPAPNMSNIRLVATVRSCIPPTNYYQVSDDNRHGPLESFIHQFTVSADHAGNQFVRFTVPHLVVQYLGSNRSENAGLSIFRVNLSLSPSNLDPVDLTIRSLGPSPYMIYGPADTADISGGSERRTITIPAQGGVPVSIKAVNPSDYPHVSIEASGVECAELDQPFFSAR